MAAFEQGEQVRHQSYGTGTVLNNLGLTVVVRFEHGIEECLIEDIEPTPSINERVKQDLWDTPLELISRLQAEAITSTNAYWGVFARSRIELLPHQLWVCRQVNQQWPTRWLVADDVGLGKTIEAGIILTPIIASGRVKRLLIICPASLVAQWQKRLREMFDIRLAQYTTQADTSRTDFWGTHSQVVVSLQTLRDDRNERHQRLMENDPWDLVVVDESHHLNIEEKSGMTLGYQLIKKMHDNRLIDSMLFLTGTPHRGKDYGFIGQLQLLRPDLFDTSYPLESQIKHLREAMIRNNKYNVTDLVGNRLFQKPRVDTEVYAYSPNERFFYDMLSEFILAGKAYASRLSISDNRTAMLVLISMQKLASSSVAAIRRAIRNRLGNIERGQQRIEKLEQLKRVYSEMRESDLGNDEALGDELARIEEEIIEASGKIRLVQDEEEALKGLLHAADDVREETKIGRILELVGERFQDRSVLFFTEYKATQSLLMSALMVHFGDGCLAFINGDDRADGVTGSDGVVRTLYMRREEAAELFNAGTVRFLVSTEAGGEGIDLQESCHTLVHVDLPWNPMRMHQRVGRINRYGQTHVVEVLSLRNPDTVESRIWDLLDAKLHRITAAFSEVMEDPEDLLQLVLGMTSPGVFHTLFADAPKTQDESLSEWFDKNTGTFGGQDAVDTVKAIVGEVSKFDFRQVSGRIPQVDLPDLRPFFETILGLNGRRVDTHDDGAISFNTPDAWVKGKPAISTKYSRMIFDRKDRSKDAAKRLLGVGHKLVDTALKQASNQYAFLATLPSELLQNPLVVFRVQDRVTGDSRKPDIVVGIELKKREMGTELLLDWQLLLKLNRLPLRKQLMRSASSAPDAVGPVYEALEAAKAILDSELDSLDHGFRVPDSSAIGMLWPVRTNANQGND